MGCCECAMLVSWVLLDVIIEDGLSTGANHWGVSTEGLLLGPSTVACPLGCVYCSGVLQNEDLGCCKCVAGQLRVAGCDHRGWAIHWGHPLGYVYCAGAICWGHPPTTVRLVPIRREIRLGRVPGAIHCWLSAVGW